MSVLMMATVIVRLAEEAEFDPNTVSPGVVGFIATAVVGLGTILIGFDLVRRVRRSRYREEIREKLQAELDEAAAAEAGAGAGAGDASAADASAADASEVSAGVADAGVTEPGAAAGNADTGEAADQGSTGPASGDTPKP